MRTLVWATSFLLLIGGCKNESADSPPPAGKSEVGAGKTAPAPTPSKKTKPRTRLEESRVVALVDTWLKTQNDGDFEAYSSLYAEKFVGVKRVGAKATRYNRGSWLKDRARMFKKPMTVEATDQYYNLSHKTAVVNFTQRWASEKFEDVGAKKLLVVEDNGTLKIGQEEMLESEVVGSGDTPEFYFLHKTGLVLHDVTVPVEHGQPKLIADRDVLSTIATVKDKDLGDELAAWKGKKVRVDGVCEAEVVGFSVLSRVIVHFGTEQEWNCDHGGGPDTVDDCVRATPEERADLAFGEGTKMVVAKLSDCDGTYARSAASAKMVIGSKINQPELVAKAETAFGKLPEVKEQSDADHKKWWVGNEEVSIFRHPSSGETLVSVSARVGDFCGGYSASSWQLWRYKDGELKPVANGTAPVAVESALDVDGDGKLELIVKGDHFGTERALVWTETLQKPVELRYQFNDCAC